MFFAAALYGLVILAGLAILWLIISRFTDAGVDRVQQYRENRLPEQMVRAKVVDKRTSRLDLALGAEGSSDRPRDTYVTFNIDNQTVEMAAVDDVYIKASPGCEGLLTYRGKTAVSFSPMTPAGREGRGERQVTE